MVVLIHLAQGWEFLLGCGRNLGHNIKVNKRNCQKSWNCPVQQHQAYLVPDSPLQELRSRVIVCCVDGRRAGDFTFLFERKYELFLITKGCFDAPEVEGRHMVDILRVRAKIPAMLERCGYKVVIASSANMYPCYSRPVLPPPLSKVISAKHCDALHANDAESMGCSLPVPVLFTSILILPGPETWECCHSSRDGM